MHAVFKSATLSSTRMHSLPWRCVSATPNSSPHQPHPRDGPPVCPRYYVPPPPRTELELQFGLCSRFGSATVPLPPLDSRTAPSVAAQPDTPSCWNLSVEVDGIECRPTITPTTPIGSLRSAISAELGVTSERIQLELDGRTLGEYNTEGGVLRASECDLYRRQKGLRVVPAHPWWV